MTNKEISAKAKRDVISLIQDECCNYISGECIMSNTQCAQMQRLRIATAKPLFACDWFLNAVLPFDKDLCATILEPHNLVKCERCNAMFAPSGNRAKYCAACAPAEHKKAKREYARKRRVSV